MSSPHFTLSPVFLNIFAPIIFSFFSYSHISSNPSHSIPQVLVCILWHVCMNKWIIDCILFHYSASALSISIISVKRSYVDPRFEYSLYTDLLHPANPSWFISHKSHMTCLYAHLWTDNCVSSHFPGCYRLCNCAWNNGWISNKWLTDFILGELDVWLPLHKAVFSDEIDCIFSLMLVQL